jgi:glycosyltransferase involved in cell wall biosynthesis
MRRHDGNPLSGIDRFLKRHQVQVILGEYLDFSLPLVEIARDLSIPLFAHAHGYDVSRRLREGDWASQYLRYNDAAGIVTMSEASKRRLIDLGLDNAKVHVVPYGVDVPDTPPRHGGRHTTRCLAVGRFVPKKAPIVTLEAFRRASAANQRLRLDYVGGGDLLPAARQFVRACGLEDRVTLHGAQPPERVTELFARADIFLQHSATDPETGDEEGLPVAVLEAMAFALPVVATCHAGIPEAVSDGESGYLVDEWDTDGMSSAIARLADDPDLGRMLGEAGWQLARERFAWERERETLLTIFDLN